MISITVLVVAGIVLALAFDVINGFHDAANSIATVVSTRVLSPRLAVLWAAFFNFVAMLIFAPRVADTISKTIHIQQGDARYVFVVMAGLVGAIVWNLFTWWLGLPSSSSHALVGGLAGAGVAHGGWSALKWSSITKIVTFIPLAPIIGAGLGFTLMLAVYWLFRRVRPASVDRIFRRGQLFSAALYSIGHGGNDAQKTMGIMMALLVAGGFMSPGTQLSLLSGKTLWIILSAQAAMAFGTAFGGWRIVKTMGMKITRLRPVGGFCAEASGALMLFWATAASIPVSTTHTITGSIIGVGATRRLSGIKWGVAGRIVWAWVLTIPASALVAAGFLELVGLAGGLVPATAVAAPLAAPAGWRTAFNVHEADPLAVTGGFTEPDAVVFLRNHPTRRGALLAGDGRAAGASRLLLLDAMPPYPARAMRLTGVAADAAFRGLPKCIAENSRGLIYVTDGLNAGDDATPEKQRVRVLGHDYEETNSFGGGLFESINGLAIDRRDRVYVSERSKGYVRRFDAAGVLDPSWELRDPAVKKMDNLVIAEELTIAGTRGVILASDEARGMIRFYALADGRFLDTTLGNASDVTPAEGQSPKAAYRARSIFAGSVEGMILHGDLLIAMDEADDENPDRELGGTIWFFDLRDQAMLNQPAGYFRAGKKTGLLGGIHKAALVGERAIEKDPRLAEGVPGGTFLSADGIAIARLHGKNVLAVANQAVFRIELFDLDALLALVGAGRMRLPPLPDLGAP